MGVDARIIVRNVPRRVITDAWLKETSWQLCRSIGADKFFISDGLPPEEYADANTGWHAAFRAHPLNAEYEAESKAGRWEFLKRETEQEATTRKVHEDRARELRQQIHESIGPPPKDRRLAIEPTGSHYREDGEPPPGTEYHQDGDPIIAREGECLLSVSLQTRYYGPGYERGDLQTICAVAEWLEINIPGCEVWYGGDSSGCCANPFGAFERLALKKHLYSQQGRDYYRSWCSRDEYGLPPACAMCPDGKYRGERYGSGHNFASLSCAGCGRNSETRDGGKTWTDTKERD